MDECPQIGGQQPPASSARDDLPSPKSNKNSWSFMINLPIQQVNHLQIRDLDGFPMISSFANLGFHVGVTLQLCKASIGKPGKDRRKGQCSKAPRGASETFFESRRSCCISTHIMFQPTINGCIINGYIHIYSIYIYTCNYIRYIYIHVINMYTHYIYIYT